MAAADGPGPGSVPPPPGPSGGAPPTPPGSGGGPAGDGAPDASEANGTDRRKIALIAGGGLGVVVLLFVVVFLVGAFGSSPPERAVKSFHASAKDGDCRSMMQLIQLPPKDELPRPKDALADVLCENANENSDRVPDRIDTRVVKEEDSSATVQAYGSVDDREWSETYQLTRTDGEWRIRWGREES